MASPGQVQLTQVLPNHRLDEAALGRYLEAHLPGFGGPLELRQFVGGQSNPTYHLQTPTKAYVLRKKPAGRLLPSAHAVDREFAVLRALQGSGVPVPAAQLLCENDAVLGQMFYVMDHVEGRVFTDRLLPGVSRADRTAMVEDQVRVLAALHRVDWRAAGLGDFGRPEQYAARQVSRWSRQYRESQVIELEAMERLLDWLPAHLPADDGEAAIAHGDFRIGNLIYHPTEPRVVAVLDWELSTIGHPFADLAYTCLGYHLPFLDGRGFGDADLAALGIPSEQDCLRSYCRHTGRADIPHWAFYLVLALFRTAAIMVGVHRRALQGNAADARALNSDTYSVVARRAWAIARASA